MADLSFGIVGGAIVTTVDKQVIILQTESSHVVASDGTWESAAAAPISIDEFCCGGAHALPAGDPLVFGAEGSPETWIFEPAIGIWTQADARPSAGYVLGASVIDRELYVVDAAARTGVATSSVAALNLDGKWRELEPVPAPISVGGVTTDGVRLIVAGTQQDENNNVIGERSPLVFALTPDRGWETLPKIPIDGQASTVVWTPQGDLLAWNYDLESARLSIAEGWTHLEPVPMDEGNCYPRSVAASFGVVGFCFGIAWFDGSTWQPIPSPPPKSHLAITADGLLAVFPLARDESP
ncbi:MAG: hypothetical protein ACR2ME_10100 [Acidimicrobiia bacterium]